LPDFTFLGQGKKLKDPLIAWNRRSSSGRTIGTLLSIGLNQSWGLVTLDILCYHVADWVF
jgi:hypothetical protein